MRFAHLVWCLVFFLAFHPIDRVRVKGSSIGQRTPGWIFGPRIFLHERQQERFVFKGACTVFSRLLRCPLGNRRGFSQRAGVREWVGVMVGVQRCLSPESNQQNNRVSPEPCTNVCERNWPLGLWLWHVCRHCEWFKSVTAYTCHDIFDVWAKFKIRKNKNINKKGSMRPGIKK